MHHWLQTKGECVNTTCESISMPLREPYGLLPVNATSSTPHTADPQHC